MPIEIPIKQAFLCRKWYDNFSSKEPTKNKSLLQANIGIITWHWANR